MAVLKSTSCLLLLCTALAPALGGAGESVVLAEGVQPLSRRDVDQARLQLWRAEHPPAYQDKVMDPSTLPPLEDADDGSQLLPGGLRTWATEVRLGHARRGEQGGLGTEAGLLFHYRHETINHGEWDLQTEWRRQISGTPGGFQPAYAASLLSTGQRFTLRNWGYPLAGGWSADAAVGDIEAGLTEALVRGYRLSLGGGAVRGLGLRVVGPDTEWHIGHGRRGQWLGSPYPGFEAGAGQLSWVGGSRRWGEQGLAGLQLVQAQGVTGGFWRQPGTFSDAGGQDIQTLAAAVGWGASAWAQDGVRWRLTALHSRSASSQVPDGAAGWGQQTSASGLYGEYGWRQAGTRHELGAYRAQRGLWFADQAVGDGSTGAYWRMDHNLRNLSWGLGVDLSRRAQAAGSWQAWRLGQNQWGVSAHVYHRLDRRSSLGGQVQLTQTRLDGTDGDRGQRSLYGSTVYQSRWFTELGDSRLRLTVRRNQALVLDAPTASGEELEWEQEWVPPSHDVAPTEWSTTLGWAHDRSASIASRYPTAGARFRYRDGSAWSWGGHLRYSARQGQLSTSQGLAGSLDAEQRLTGGWRLGAALHMNQATVRTAANAWAGQTVQLSRSRDVQFQVFLRHEGQAGRPRMGAGGAGGIEGVVFLDGSRDGLQQTGEVGAPGVEVWLNQRWRTVTDAQGRFEFSQVPTGVQRVSLRLETVPLPWGPGPDSQTSVEVPLRGRVLVSLPLVRVAP